MKILLATGKTFGRIETNIFEYTKLTCGYNCEFAIIFLMVNQCNIKLILMSHIQSFTMSDLS